MSLWKTKWGYRAEFLFKGKRVIAKGFFKYKDDARSWIREEKEKLKSQEKSSSPAERHDLSFWLLAQKYLADSKVNFVRKTFDEKKSCLERFYERIGDISALDVDPPTVLDFINERAKAASNNAANKDRKNLKAFYRWIQDMMGVLHDPTAPIKKKPHFKKSRRLIPIKDVLKVMLVAKGHERVLLGVYWHTGARKGEPLRWTWADDINFEERWVRLGTRKTRSREMRYEKLWMNDDLYRLLKWQWKHRHPTSPFVFCHMNPKSKLYGKRFVARWKLLKKLCKRANVEAFGYHDIRHTVAKYLNDLQKVGLKQVQQVLRHRKQSTTEMYVEGNYSDTREVMGLLELSNLRKFQ